MEIKANNNNTDSSCGGSDVAVVTTTPSSPTMVNNNTVDTTAAAVGTVTITNTTNTTTSNGVGGNINDYLNTLPRSVRWRIQLGLLVIDPSSSLSSSSSLDDLYHYNIDLISDQNKRFKELEEKYSEEEKKEGQEEEEENNNNNSTIENADGVVDATTTTTTAEQSSSIDPLTAMVLEEEAKESRKQELYLKYRKERARFKRGLTTDDGNRPGGNSIDSEETSGIDKASLSIIGKDLNRLPHPTDSIIIGHHQKNTNTNTNTNTTNFNSEQRIETLREILYIYAQEHPSMGYRQGMHEVASYLLYVLELEQLHYNNKDDNNIIPSSSFSIKSICYYLLERTLDELQTAYDASGDQSLDHMSQAILRKIYQNDTMLYQHLTTSTNIPPPPIYCTRWVRLLFSREVNGYENVFKLWDIFFNIYYKNTILAKAAANNLPPPSSNNNNNNNGELMNVLEVTAASRILLLRNALLNPDSNSLDLLMNIPSLSDISPLTTTLQQLIEQGDTEQPIQLPTCSQLVQQQQQQIQQPSSFQPNFQSEQQQQQQHSSPSKSSSSFSLKAVRQSLGQKGESIRKKIINTTNEWKQRELSGSGSGSFNAGNSMGGTIGSGGGGSSSSPFVIPSQTQAVVVSSASAVAAAASQVLRNHVVSSGPTETVLFDDPLLNPGGSSSSSGGPMVDPTHSFVNERERERVWSQDLQRRIWTIQEFLMSLEQKAATTTTATTNNNVNTTNNNNDENNGTTTTTGSSTTATSPSSKSNSGFNGHVPRAVWEALAEMDRIQHEIQNCSMEG